MVEFCVEISFTDNNGVNAYKEIFAAPVMGRREPRIAA